MFCRIARQNRDAQRMTGFRAHSQVPWHRILEWRFSCEQVRLRSAATRVVGGEQVGELIGNACMGECTSTAESTRKHSTKLSRNVRSKKGGCDASRWFGDSQSSLFDTLDFLPSRSIDS